MDKNNQKVAFYLKLIGEVLVVAARIILTDYPSNPTLPSGE